MFAERLIRARKAAGLSMSALASEVGVSANAIKKYEHGENMPSSTNLLKLAKALNVRSEYFFRPVRVELKGVEYRKRANTPQRLIDRINGDVMEQAERWVELLGLFPDSVVPVPGFSQPGGMPDKITSLEAIEAIADQVRSEWSLGLNPIPDMIDTLESNGVMIITTAVESDKKFDGLAGAIEGAPLVVISAHQPGDRQRFTLAHELGHLVLQGRLAPGMEEEKACNRFAGAFLLPKQAILQHLGTNRTALEPQELHLLKHEFGISMMSILVRAGQCGVIRESLQKRYYYRFGQLGWRSLEPGEPYPNEQTYLFRQLVYRALGEDYIGESKAAELMGVSLTHFHKERKLGGMGATADQ
ncbi:helix-turn-helix domain-containing protein [Sedimenticola hydrogenitrophicus]|uniref:helix-turn-helix domain-containing protein n=1 Tax=Sedimenticola hydrogenitrophicus TaxID=2967975 RepID=UPI0023AF911B|nr:XRE family transcriptional regulator [Sedimenticola hydrogenitrophicus]